MLVRVKLIQIHVHVNCSNPQSIYTNNSPCIFCWKMGAIDKNVYFESNLSISSVFVYKNCEKS